ncbi:hypothetical protein CBL_05825 [Carabus blaptoides fortunei]
MFMYTVLIVCAVVAVQVNAELNLIVKKYEMCEGFKDTPIKLYATIKKHNNTVHMINGGGSSPFDVGENVVIHLHAQTFEDGKWNTILNAEEKDPCKLLNDYVGEMWHDMEKQLKIPVGECPLPAGDYELKDYALDFSKMAYQKVPKGQLRLQANATKGDELVLCMDAEFESV